MSLTYTEKGKEFSLYNFYIGGLSYEGSTKRLVNITDNIENNISITTSRDGSAMVVSNINFFIKTSDDDYKYILDEVNISGLPFLIIQVNEDSNDNTIIFNGTIKTCEYNFIGGIRPDYIKYNVTLEHKSAELSKYIFNKTINKFDISISEFITNIIRSDDRLLKYEESLDKIELTDIYGDTMLDSSNNLYHILISEKKLKSSNYPKIGDTFYVRYGSTQQYLKYSTIVSIQKYPSYTLEHTLAQCNMNFSITNFRNIKAPLEITVTIERNSDTTYSAKFSYPTSDGYSNSYEYGYVTNGEFGKECTILRVNDGDKILSTFKIDEIPYGSYTADIYYEYLKIEFVDEYMYLKSYNNEPVTIGIGYINSTNIDDKVYNPSTDLKYIKNIFNDMLDKYNKIYKITNKCEIELENYDITRKNTVILSSKLGNGYDDIDRLVDNLSLSSDSGNIVNNLLMSDYKNEREEESTIIIDEVKPKENLYFNTYLPISNSVSNFNKNNTVSSYLKLGNNDTAYAAIKYNTISEIDGYLKSIDVKIRRNQFNEDSFLLTSINDDVIQVNSSSNISTSLEIYPRFLYLNKGDDISVEFSIFEPHTDMSIESFTETGVLINNKKKYEIDISNYPSRFDSGEYYKMYINNNGVYHYLKFESYNSTSSLFYFTEIVEQNYEDSFYNCEIYLMSNEAVDELIEFEVSNDGNNSNDSIYLIRKDGTTYSEDNESNINTSFSFQKSYCFAYASSNIGDDYNGVPSILYLNSNNSSSLDVIIKGYIASDLHNKFFYNLISDSAQSYIEIYNKKEDTWITRKVIKFVNSTGTITLSEAITLDSDYYYNDSSEFCLFRRVFSTNTISLSQKDLTDKFYESYIVEGSGAYGFNLQVDRNAIEYLLNESGEDYWSGIFLNKGNILGARFTTYENDLKNYQNIDSIERYGYYDEIHNTSISTAEDLELYLEKIINERQKNKLYGSITLKVNQFDYSDVVLNANYILLDSTFFTSKHSTDENGVYFKVILEQTTLNNKIHGQNEIYVTYTIEEVI